VTKAHYRRVCDDALYKLTTFTFFYLLHCKCKTINIHTASALHGVLAYAPAFVSNQFG